MPTLVVKYSALVSDDNGNENGSIISTPFLEGVDIDTVNKVVQVHLGT